MNNAREPIISVQEQQQTREEIQLGIKCKSKYTDKCYAEYNVNSLRQGFGQLKDIRYETIEFGKPTLVIHSPTLEKSENDIVISTNNVMKELEKIELRKRFAVVHTEKYIYVIGGYIYDPRIPIRKKVINDYKYDVQTKKLIPIQPLPNGAIGFGLCVDEDFIYAIGGNDVNNKPFSDCFALTIGNSNEKWIKLPNLPAPTSGPGVGVYNGELHCIGGYDVLSNESIVHGEYLLLRYPEDKQWRYGSEVDIPRARPLVVILPSNSIHKRSVYIAGGFNINSNTRKPFIVPDIQLYNENTQRWQHVTTIPNLDLSHALSFNDNKLNISEIIEVKDQLPVTNLLRTYDLIKSSWIDKKNEPNLPMKTKPSTLKLPNSNTPQTPIKSGIKKPLVSPNKIPINTKRNDISKSPNKQINNRIKKK